MWRNLPTRKKERVGFLCFERPEWIFQKLLRQMKPIAKKVVLCHPLPNSPCPSTGCIQKAILIRRFGRWGSCCLVTFWIFWVKDPKGAWGLACCPAAHVMYLLKHLSGGQSQRSELNITLCCFSFQEGEQFVKKIGGIFAFKVKDGPGGKEATWVVDVKNGRGSVLPNSGWCSDDLADKLTEEDGGLPWWPRKGWL